MVPYQVGWLSVERRVPKYENYQKSARQPSAQFCARVLLLATWAGCGRIESDGSAALDAHDQATSKSDSGNTRIEESDAGQLDALPADPGLGGDANLGPVDPATVTGTVLDRVTRRPLTGRRVIIGEKTTTTDDNGAFAIANVGPVYDVTIVEPDQSRFSLYQRLSRRDPVLAHKSSDAPDPTVHTATVKGTLSGAGSYPLGLSDLVVVYFFSAQADGHTFVGGGLSAVPSGPDYGPIALRWNGAGTLAGELVAVGTLSTAADGGHATWVAHKTLTVASDGAPVVNLAFTAASDGHVAGGIQVPAGDVVGFTTVSHRLPIANAEVPLETDEDPANAFDYVLPDLSEVGGELCMTAGSSSGAVTRRCGITLGTSDISLTVQASPSFTGLVDGSTISTATPIAFTQFDGGMHELECHSTVSARTIDVFTAATAVSPTDLASAGAALVAGTSYACRITGLGPFGTMDDVVGKDGLSAPFPAEQRQSPSRAIQLTIMP